MHSAFHIASKTSKDLWSLHLPRDFAAVILFSLLGITITFALISCWGAEVITAMLAQLN